MPPSVLVPVSVGTTNLTLVVNNVRNVGSFKPVSSFSALIANSDSFRSLFSTAVGWTNTQASSFTTGVSGTNNYKGEVNTFLFSLSGLSGTQNYVRVTINSAFPAVTIAPAGARRVDNYNLDFDCNSTACSLSVSLTNPTATGSFTFSLNSYINDTAVEYQVGTSTSNSWTYDCATTNCRSCEANGSCITCYNSSITPFWIFSTSAKTCISDCPPGFFSTNANTTCTPCDSNCTECIASSRQCTKCASNYFLDTVYAICVPTCLPGYFANSLNS